MVIELTDSFSGASGKSLNPEPSDFLKNTKVLLFYQFINKSGDGFIMFQS